MKNALKLLKTTMKLMKIILKFWECRIFVKKQKRQNIISKIYYKSKKAVKMIKNGKNH